MGLKHGQPRIKSKSFDRECLKWNKEVEGVFPSLCDWLDPEVPVNWLADMMSVMYLCRNIDFMLLTKRPDQWKNRITLACKAMDICKDGYDSTEGWLYDIAFPNVFIGTSCENQKTADERIPLLKKIPAVKRFLSVEPLLEPIRFSGVKTDGCGAPLSYDHLSKIDWVIVGGESGCNARPCDIEWIREIVKQCKAASVPCFVKQIGSNPIMNKIEFRCKHPKGGTPHEWPEDIQTRETL
jgi:protein gp37